MNSRSYRLGYACIGLNVAPAKFRTVTLTWVKKQTPDAVRERLFSIYNDNAQYLINILKYNIANNFWAYRISSSLFPLADHPDYSRYWFDWTISSNILTNLRAYVKNYIYLGGRFEIHPSQYCSISSANDTVRKNSLNYLEYHNDLLHAIGVPPGLQNCNITLHISNGSDIEQAALYTNLSLTALSRGVMSRLCFEHEDKGGWTTQQIAKYFPQIPIILDNLHVTSNPISANDDFNELIPVVQASWRGIRPLMHVSEGIDGPSDRRHADCITKIDQRFIDNFDIVCENKRKDQGIPECYYKN